MDGRKDVCPMKTWFHQSQEVLFRNAWRRKIQGEPVDPDPPGKTAIKRR